MEIERKYLLREMPAIPDVQQAEIWLIEQGYLEPNHASALREGRLRRTTLSDGSIECFHTIKRGVGVVREEFENRITSAEFEEAWPRTTGARLRKTRFRFPVGGLIWEIDVFEGIDLVLAEVELPASDTPVEFPAWLEPCVVREVTDDPAFTNASIARRMGQVSIEE